MEPCTMSAPDALSHSVVRALLVTDLVDSTRIVEQLGDRRAAEVLAQDEDAARALARRHGGREIDKSDGFLFLFEHAWQAVAFALDYHAALAALSAGLPVRLAARIGIHVGEVYLSENSAEAIAAGAKPVEVNGLAKPVAARLMSAAHGGQTLLSATACELARRPSEERAAPGALRWAEHGGYRFKGIEGRVQVVEVGAQPGFVPRPPLEGPKVESMRRRQRRHFLQAAAAVGVAASLPLGFAIHRQSRFGFRERDWVLIADWRHVLDDSDLLAIVSTAFRIAIEQSRFAYVINDAALRDGLRRMRREDARLDRSSATELAKRERAGAVILPAIGAADAARFRLSAEVVDPWTDRVIRLLSVDASRDRLIEALDELAAKVRTALGESRPTIERDSVALAKVTTTDLDALRAYSLAELSIRDRRFEEALRLFEQALAFDPEFGTAHAKLGTVNNILRQPQRAEQHWRQALDLEDRLTRREQMYVQGCLSNLADPLEMRGRWGAMHALFPDDAAAANNVGWIEWTQFADYGAAEAPFRSAMAIPHPWNFASQHHLAYALLGQGKLDAALAAARESLERSGNATHFGLVRALLAAGRAADAAQLVDRFGGEDSPQLATDRENARLLVHVFRGEDAAALAVAEGLESAALRWAFPDAQRSAQRARLLLVTDERERRGVFDDLVRATLTELRDGHGGAISLPAFEQMVLAAIAARSGWNDAFDRLRELAPGSRWRRFPAVQAMLHVAEGWRALADGSPAEAIEAARQARAVTPLYATLELEAEAYRRLGQSTQQRQRARLASEHLATGLAENFNYFSTHLANLLAWRRLREAA
jgi:putative peptide modification system cyclase